MFDRVSARVRVRVRKKKSENDGGAFALTLTPALFFAPLFAKKCYQDGLASLIIPLNIKKKTTVQVESESEEAQSAASP